MFKIYFLKFNVFSQNFKTFEELMTDIQNLNLDCIFYKNDQIIGFSECVDGRMSMFFLNIS